MNTKHTAIATELEYYSDTPLFNTKAVVQQTGIPAPTLRAWERRYQLLSPERADNTYRLYSERDINLIRWLKDQVDTGMSISQAIALFRHLNEEHTAASKESSSAFSIALPQPVAEPLEAEEKADEKAQYPLLDSAHDMLESPPSKNDTMEIIQNHLIEIFQSLDEQTAHVLMGSVLSLYSVEQVCLGIVTPTLWKIGQLWEEGKITVTVEHFASNFFRALLTNRFYVTPGPLQGPLVLVASAPQEAHELAALMLALFLRRQGIRVAYLGQSIETIGLLHTVRRLKPTLICLSVTMPNYISNLVQLSQLLQHIPIPRPTLVFGGQAFVHQDHLIESIAGCYVSGDLATVASKLQSMILAQTDYSGSST
ncbi:MerR family transcriptional regulator [Tengunoibacter tsumagoiensis]|uniref:MerR family transcriptional regulator n=1 Tax=Tengunoibacter tsumagoiensis TaxID=2014871 RepID=A0A401ZTY4_9CHLR|nr:MerR family transcriptional regulator [Tengunoibacter tsumagoiensis]GCE10256.1 MerR family transcriptional regulator [Tengunoibacter tsumagoiensis]